MMKKVVDLSNSDLQKNADGRLTTKPHHKEFYASKTVENAFLQMYFLFLIKLKK